MGATGTVTLSTDSFDVTSITAYRHQKTGLLADVNNINVPTALLDVRFTKHFTYQELRAVSGFDGPFRLIFGGTYLENVQRGGQRVALLNPAFTVGDGFVSDKIRNWSVYAEAGYDLTDRVSLTASGRYMRETNHANFTRPIVSAAKTVQQKFVPAVTVKYDIGRGNVYARWARGFKTGGVNLATPAAYYPQPEEGSLFGPETVDTFEIGAKDGLLDGRLQLTAAIFYNSFKNLQVNAANRPAYPQITTAIVNADSARTYGVEGSASWRIAPPLTIGAAAGYLNAKYKDFRLVNSIVLQDFDQSGLRMPKAPKWQLSFTADLDQPVSADYRVVANLLVSHVSQVLFQRSATPAFTPDAVGPAYWLTNARIGVRTTDDRFGVALVADNLFNERYLVYGQSFATGVNGGWGNPRVVRGEFTVRF